MLMNLYSYKAIFFTIVEDYRRWYNSLPDKSNKTWDALHKVFIKIWGTKGDPNMLLLQFSEMKNKENEIVKEFDTIFETLLQQIPDNIFFIFFDRNGWRDFN
jgi:hypothetical protein